LPNNTVAQQSGDKRPFQAIDGSELRRIILAEVERAIEADQKFRRHLTYPVFSFAFNIVIHAYPMEPPEFNVEGRYRRAPESGEIPKGDPDRIELEGRLDVDAPAPGGLAPDEARERANIPVPMPAHAPLGKSGTMTVDEPQTKASEKREDKLDDPAAIASGQTSPTAAKRLAEERKGGVKPPSPSPPPSPAPNEPRNRPGSSPNFARSVDLATRAAPDGTRVDDNIGTVKGG
jgi:hypothetical protein